MVSFLFSFAVDAGRGRRPVAVDDPTGPRAAREEDRCRRIIDSAPSCIAHVKGALPADDSADFILQKAYEKCAGIMTFGPGGTYGEDGAAPTSSYMVLTWIGIAVMVAVIVDWVI